MQPHEHCCKFLLLPLLVFLITNRTQVRSEESSSSELQAEHRLLNGDHATFFDRASSVPDDLPQIKALNVACEKNKMRVFIEFDRPFYGMVFSKGHFSDRTCLHLPPTSGRLNADFEIGLPLCGLTARTGQDSTGTGAYIENTIIIQYDPLVQEVWDQARKLRCTWYDFYEKSVAFKPYNVDSVQAVTANFLGDNLQCWMQIQAGKGPWASEVSGIVKIGQWMTMVLAIKDDDNKFDMFVRNCVAHDGKRPPIQLVDNDGCVVRPKVMSPFTKVKNFGSSASVVSYAYFQAFKFPDSMEVFFQCVIQVCRDQCPEPQCQQQGSGNSFTNEIADRNPQPQPKPQPQPQPLPPPPPPSANHLTSELSQFPPPPPHLLANDKVHFIYPGSHDGGHPLPPIPAPVPVPLSHGYASIGRIGVPSPSLPSGNPESTVPPPTTRDNDGHSDVGSSSMEKVVVIPAIAGPRAYTDVVEDFENSPDPDGSSSGGNRRKRLADDKSTDVKTSGHLRVVAPGDVAFSLGIANETVVVAGQSESERNAVCVPLSGFAAGLALLLCLICIMLLVASFLYLRLRTYKAKELAQIFQ